MPTRASEGDRAKVDPVLTRVQEMAARIGGRSQFDLHAPRHSGGRDLTVDVLVGVPAGRVTTATFPLILRGISDRAELEVRERPEIGNLRIAISFPAPGDFHPDAGCRVGTSEPCDAGLHGVILIYPFEESAVESVLRQGCAVSVLESYDRLGIDVIDTDDEAAISSLVGSLHAIGHTRIGFLSWDYPVGGHWVGRRYSGFVAGLQARGLTPVAKWVLNAGEGHPRLSPEEVADAAARAVVESGVTAWVCAADHQAYPLIRSLQARGIRVPNDCSVTGFDGLEAPEGLPRATSVRVAHEHIGCSALTRMINRIMYPSSPPRKILVDAQPIPGDTIAAPREP